MKDQPKRRKAGTGSITLRRGRYVAYLPLPKKKRLWVGSFETEEQAEQMLHTVILARGASAGNIPTLRQWGESYLYSIRDHRSLQSTADMWRSILCDAAFIDDPLNELTTLTLRQWAKDLPAKRKKRSVLKTGTGTRRTITLRQPIARSYAAAALQLLKAMLQSAVGIFLDKNPAEGAAVPPDRNRPKYMIPTYLTVREVELLLSCRSCSIAVGLPPSDVEMLVECPHMPFEQRVVFCIATHQAPREGEIAGMNWEDVEWDRDGSGWTIQRSWNDATTKSRVQTWQPLLPRTERFLRTWWKLAGYPESGIMFPSSRGPRYKRIGPRRAFVEAHLDMMPASTVATLGRQVGLKLTTDDVHKIRSYVRRGMAERALKHRYTKGYDWGWSDTKERHMTRLGWWRRMGIRKQIRFHDLRDTCASHLLSGSWGPKWSLNEVAAHLSHSSTSVTEKRYAHLVRDAKLNNARATESVGAAELAAIARRTREETRQNSGVLLASAESEVEPSKYLGSLAPEAGLEPATTRLTGLRSGPEIKHLADEKHSATAPTPGTRIAMQRLAEGTLLRERPARAKEDA